MYFITNDVKKKKTKKKLDNSKEKCWADAITC